MSSDQDPAGTPLIFTLSDHRALLPPDLDERTQPALGRSTLARFTNGELYARIESPVSGRICAVLGSLAAPDERMLSVLLLAHTLKREGARRVLALLPYLGYARQDRADPGQSLGIAWAGALLRAAGFDRVLTLDLHSSRAAAQLGLPIDSLSPAPLFAEQLARSGLDDLTVVAPDEGALARCEAVIRAAGITAPLAYLQKRRDASGIAHSALIGTVTRRVAIVDDILDTGGTLVSACAQLGRAGAREITILVTHGLFTGERWRELEALGVRRIYTTDSIPGAAERGGAIVEALPIAEVLLGALANAPADRRGLPAGPYQ